jgi:hypothetical protein
LRQCFFQASDVNRVNSVKKLQFLTSHWRKKSSNNQKMPIFGCVDAVESLFRTRNSQFL